MPASNTASHFPGSLAVVRASSEVSAILNGCVLTVQYILSVRISEHHRLLAAYSHLYSYTSSKYFSEYWI